MLGFKGSLTSDACVERSDPWGLCAKNFNVVKSGVKFCFDDSEAEFVGKIYLENDR